MPRHAARRPRRTLLLRSAIGVAGALVVAERVPAADRSWGNTAGGTFSTATNWINGIVAGVNDVAVFDRSRGTSQTTYTVSFGASAQNQAVRVSNDLVTFNLNGRTYTTTQITGNEIGTSSSASLQARLTINNGTFNATGLLTPQVLVGAAPGATGALTLANNGVLAGSPRLLIGAGSATGNFTVNAGTATLNTLDVGSGVGGVGNAVITLPFSTVTTNTLLVGNAGNGAISTNTGALLQNSGPATIGNAVGSRGLVTVDASGRWVQSGTLLIGNAGAGTVHVLGGGSLVGEAAILGSSTGGFGRLNITGSGSKATVGNFTIGESGVGSMSISGGGNVTNNLGVTRIGSNAGGFVGISSGGTWFTGGTTVLADGTNSTAQIDVQDPGSLWNNAGQLSVGKGGSAALNITGGGIISCSRAILGLNPSASGRIIVDGAASRFISTGTLLIGATGPAGTGELRITGGGRVESGATQIRNAGSRVLVEGQDSQWITTDLSVNFAAGSAGGLTINAGGVVQCTDADVPNTVSGGQGSASISGSNSQWRVTNRLTIGHHTFSPDGAHGTLTIDAGALVEVGNTLFVGNGGIINLDEATLRVGFLSFADTPTFNFNSGTVRITSNPSLSASFLDELLGPAHAIAAGRNLEIGGTPALTSPLVLNGGILSVPTLAVGSPLQFDSGTFNLTSANLTIGSGGLLGSAITLDDRNINVTNATTIDSDGQLIFRGGSFFSGGGITNNGQIIVDVPAAFRGATTTFRNAIVNDGELRIEAGAAATFVAGLTGTGSFTGGGTKFFESGSVSVGRLASGGSTVVRADAIVQADTIREASLTVEGLARVRPNTEASRVDTLLIPAGGKLDLTSNALILDYAGSSPINEVRALITSGFAGGSWNGSGINSSMAASQPNRALGMAEATDIGSPATFAGEPIDATSVLVRFTLPGDANLDRAVGLGDFALLAANFNQPSRWSKGDFNYDGTTGIGDFALLAANFNQVLPAATPLARGAAAVPEPAVAALLAAAAASVLAGRRGRWRR